MKKIRVTFCVLVFLIGTAGGALGQGSYIIDEYVTEWGSEGTGPGQFTYANGMAVDSANHVYVSESGVSQGRVQVFDSEGNFLAQIGSCCGSLPGEFYRTNDVAVDASDMVYVSDDMNRRVQKFTRSGSGASVTFSFHSLFPVGSYPYGLAFDPSGNPYVARYWAFDVRKYSPSGSSLLGTWTYYGGYPYQILPIDAAVDSQGNFYVATHWAMYSWLGGDWIYKYSPAGAFLTKWGSHGTGDGLFNSLNRIWIDESDNLYAADQENHRIQVFRTDGTFLGWYGKGTATTGWHEPGSGETGVPGSGPGEFNVPVALAVDREGYLYVSDHGNHRIQKFSRRSPNAAPTAEAGPDGSAIAGEAVSFDGGGSSDPDGSIITWAWDFGDGSTATGQAVTHAYAAAGTWTVTLTVTDDRGATGSDTATVTVITPARAVGDLKATIEMLEIYSGIKTSLIAQLNAAINYLNAGQTALAVDVLNAFINHVEAQRGKKIPADTADALIAEALRIIGAIR